MSVPRRPEVPSLRASFFEEQARAGGEPAPGFLATPHQTFSNPFRTDFRKQQTLVASSAGQRGVSAIAFDPKPKATAGRTTRRMESGTQQSATGAGDYLNESARFSLWPDTARSTLPLGTSRLPAQEPFLIFEAFFRESVPESSEESARARVVGIKYFVEDSTMSIREKTTGNSGIALGNMLKRQRVPHIGPLDLCVGGDVEIYGIRYHITNCDLFTKEFLEQNGVTVPSPEEIPTNTHDEHRARVERRNPFRFREQGFEDSFVRFMKDDRKVLRFYCSWDDRKSVNGHVHYLIVKFFVADDTVEVSEIERDPDHPGEERTRSFLRRQRVPKDLAMLERTVRVTGVGTARTQKVPNIGPMDLLLGRRVMILGRDVLVHDCDEFTRAYLVRSLGVPEEDLVPVGFSELDLARPEPVLNPVPPFNGFGSDEDTMRNVRNIHVKAPRPDDSKFLAHGQTYYNFSAKFVPEKVSHFDRDREFVIRFYPVDDTISVTEKRKEGGYGGMFAARSTAPRPENRTVLYTLDDLTVGATIVVSGREFVITGTDRATEGIVSERAALREQMFEKACDETREVIAKATPAVRDGLRAAETAPDGTMPADAFKELFYRYRLAVSPQTIAHLVGKFSSRESAGRVLYRTFIADLLGDRDVPSGLGMIDTIADVRSSTVRQRSFQQALQSIREVCFYRGPALLTALRKMDSAGRGVVGIDALLRAFQSLGSRVSEDDIRTVVLELGFAEEAVPFERFTTSVENFG